MDGYIIALIAVGCVAVCLTAWGVWENHAVQCNSVEVASEKLPAAFDGFTFAHISDLHNAKFGRGQKNLLARLRESAPDAIVITGDLIDKRRPGMRRALRFAELAVKIAPVYYVTGNHEAKSKEFPLLKEALGRLGVRLLLDRAETIERAGERIVLAGLSDARFETADKRAFAAVSAEKLGHFLPQDGEFTVLLSHRPELFSVYRAAGVDLALCGHAHGGQFRIPLLGGVIAPDQGLFPKYSEGLYSEDGEGDGRQPRAGEQFRAHPPEQPSRGRENRFKVREITPISRAALRSGRTKGGATRFFARKTPTQRMVS